MDLGSAKKLVNIQLVPRQDIDQPDTRRNFEIQASNTNDFSSYVVEAVSFRTH